MCVRTFSGGVGLHEALAGAGILEFWRQPGELGQVLVDDADLGRERVVVQIAGEVPSRVACEAVSGPFNVTAVRVRRGGAERIPRPPIIKTAGLSAMAGERGREADSAVQ